MFIKIKYKKKDEELRKAVLQYKSKNWKKIATAMPGRSDVQCLHRWQKVLNPDLVKGPWTKEVSSSPLFPPYSILFIYLL